MRAEHSQDSVSSCFSLRSCVIFREASSLLGMPLPGVSAGTFRAFKQPFWLSPGSNSSSVNHRGLGELLIPFSSLWFPGKGAESGALCSWISSTASCTSWCNIPEPELAMRNWLCGAPGGPFPRWGAAGTFIHGFTLSLGEQDVLWQCLWRGWGSGLGTGSFPVFLGIPGAQRCSALSCSTRGRGQD